MSQLRFPHTVIRASAGSGKTHQLTNRYLGLLAAEVSPDTILATTFTRKAAGEILDRVLLRLAVAAGDAGEGKTLAEQIGKTNFGSKDFATLLRKLLRELHRVRIGTLDSFYVKLAGSFGLEFGLPAGWTIGEDIDDLALQQQALERLLEREDPDVLTRLYQRLTHGQTKRGVHAALSEIVKDLYRIQQETKAEAWQRLIVPKRPSPAERDDLLGRIEGFDLSGQSRMVTPRNDDVERARRADWEGLLKTGLCGKVQSGENAFFKKAIPDGLIALYRELIDHARADLIEPVAEQTKATRDFLDGLAQELSALKQESGALRFEEVTQAIVNSLRQQELGRDALAFRLDGAIEHLLLDEFQDTSQAQWLVLRPIAQAITRSREGPTRSFFCVGDVKQAIYGWRGGMAEIFDTLREALGELHEEPLNESRRSAQPVIDAVNEVFENLDRFETDEKYRAGIDSWARRFQHHETHRKGVSGYVCLHSGPKKPEQPDGGNDVDAHREIHCRFVAEKVRELTQKAPGRTVGVLCRTNPTVARMIYELRQLNVEASEEGGNPLTDSPAVELMLSLFLLADHPGNSVAWFHLRNSPLKDDLQRFRDADSLARELRRDLLLGGYASVTQTWSQRISSACNRRDLGRLEQLVELAYSYQARSTLRTDDFVRWVRGKRMPDPSAVSVRVMTIHAAKGLEFDAVVLPELDSALTGQSPAFVAGRDPKTLDVDFVCRYANDDIQKLLAPDERRAFEEKRRSSIEESLSTLYVAMTRAIHALYLYIPGPRRPNVKASWYNLLLATLARGKELQENTLLQDFGNANWHQVESTEAPRKQDRETEQPKHINFQTASLEHRRGMERVAPSRREGGGRVVLNHLFRPSEGTGTAAGTLYHAWFESIRWLDENTVTDASLREIAEKMRARIPSDIWSRLDELLANFHSWLENPAVNGVLRKSAYGDPSRAGFPAALKSLWKKQVVPMRVETERRFLVHEGDKFWNGSLDRIVWLGEGNRIVAADVLDFKTDKIELEDRKALLDRVNHYRPQVEAYRRVVARLAQIPEDHISARLIFTIAGSIEEV